MFLSVALVAIPGGIFSAGFVAEFQNANLRKIERDVRREDARQDNRDEEERAALARGIGQVRAYVALLGELARHAGQGAPTPNEAKTAPTREERKEAK